MDIDLFLLIGRGSRAGGRGCRSRSCRRRGRGRCRLSRGGCNYLDAIGRWLGGFWCGGRGGGGSRGLGLFLRLSRLNRPKIDRVRYKIRQKTCKNIINRAHSVDALCPPLLPSRPASPLAQHSAPEYSGGVIESWVYSVHSRGTGRVTLLSSAEGLLTTPSWQAEQTDSMPCFVWV